jgi:hypothetical protein
MRSIVRRGLLVLVAGAGVLAVAAPATGIMAPASAPMSAAREASAVVDGIAFGYLPAGLGQASDFSYSYDEVDFAARVWESGSDETGWSVDLDIAVLRGDRLRSGQALHDWFIPYEDRPPAEAHYVPVQVDGRPGWLCRDQVFWLLRPGLAVSVRLGRAHWSQHDVVRIADAAHEVPQVH